ncbi:MAG: DUF1819 family protein [Aestuariivita sp.]|nr:DUF1819 family protein [Aestuariivita sp.]
MSFSTGGLFFYESVEFARLHIPRESWSETRNRAVTARITQMPKDTSNSRSIIEIKNRISTFSTIELEFFLDDADRVDQKAMLWIACCRVYRFVREFAVDVIRDRYVSYYDVLPPESFDVFFNDKTEENEDLTRIKKSTLLKLRQVLFRIMREADILTDQNEIKKSFLSLQLTSLIRDNNQAE